LTGRAARVAAARWFRWEKKKMNASTQKLSLWERGNRLIGRRLQTYVRRLVLYRTQQALSQLSDHMLRDIGLTREDIAIGHFERRVRRERSKQGW
jgi:uncharacterized protein YjiS (DUF1127 family)